MTPQSIIEVVRGQTNDNDPEYPRIADTELLGYVNEGIKSVSNLVPDLFLQTGDIACTAGKTEQCITFDDAQKLIEVIRIKDGTQVFPVNMKDLAAFNPAWAADSAAAAQNWMKNPNDPLRFYIYPKAPEMQLLEVLYVRTPAVYGLTEEIEELPASMHAALADYVIFRVETRDDEHAVSARSNSHYQAFLAGIGIPPQQAGKS